MFGLLSYGVIQHQASVWFDHIMDSPLVRRGTLVYVGPPVSGGQKRRRRNALPEVFLILFKMNERRVISGLMTIDAVRSFTPGDHTGLQEQYLRFVESGASLSRSEYVLWSVEQVFVFADGEFELNTDAFAFDGLVCGLSQQGEVCLQAKRIRSGGQEVTLGELYGLTQKLRVWRFPFQSVAEAVSRGRCTTFVSTVNQCLAVGVPVPPRHMILAPSVGSQDALGQPDSSDTEDEELEAQPNAPHPAYSVDTIFNSLRVASMLKNKGNLAEVVKGVLPIVLPVASVHTVLAEMSESHLVPGKKGVLNNEHKLDMLEILWQREQHELWTRCRYLMADSSLKTYNLLVHP